MESINYYEETKKLITNYTYLLAAKENLIERLVEQNSKLLGIKSLDMSGMPKGSGGDTDKILNLIYQKEVLIERLNKTNSRIEKIEKAFSALSENEMDFIRAAFNEDKTDTLIAFELGISKKVLCTRKQKMVAKVAKVIWGYM